MNTREFYQSNATDITALDTRLQLIVRLVFAAQPASVLDVGCGRGALLSALYEKLPNARMRGVDISEASVDATRQRGFDAAVGDIANGLAIESGSMDAVVFGEILEHLVDPDAALIEISRILRVGGTLVITTPNLASWFNRLLLLVGVQPIFTETSLHVNLGRRFELLGQWRPTQGHLKIFTRKALEEMLEGNGYSIEWFGAAPFPVKTPLESIDRVFCNVPSLASNFVVVARSSGRRQTSYPSAPRAGIQL